MRPSLELSSLLLATTALAQTYSTCKDNLSSCPAAPAQQDAVFNTKFSSGGTPPSGWSQAVCKGKTTYDSNGAGLTVAASGDCPSLEADNYFFFGLAEVKIKAAPGQGIVSSIVLESQALDEVDWEFIGGENYRVQSNYFGRGDVSTYDRMVYVPVTNPQQQWHTYAVNWTTSAITWLIDGAPVRTLNYADAKGGTRFPQTPMKLKVGIWAGGDSSNPKGTVDWAGGVTDYAKGPFSMYVESINIKNYSPASQYKYKDNSGTWQSIEVIGGSAGGQANPSQVAAQQSSVASALSSVTGLSTGSAVPVNPLATATAGNATAKGITTSTAANGTFVIVGTGSRTSSSARATSTGATSAAVTNAAGGMLSLALVGLGFAMFS